MEFSLVLLFHVELLQNLFNILNQRQLQFSCTLISVDCHFKKILHTSWHSNNDQLNTLCTYYLTWIYQTFCTFISMSASSYISSFWAYKSWLLFLEPHSPMIVPCTTLPNHHIRKLSLCVSTLNTNYLLLLCSALPRWLSFWLLRKKFLCS